MTSKTEIVATYDLPYTIDWYQTFPPEYMYSSYTCDEDGNERDNWRVDYKKYIEMLAWKCADYIWENHDAVTKVKVISTYSPPYYNYVTDSAEIEIEYDSDKVEELVSKFETAFYAWLNEFHDCIYSSEDITDKDKLLFYIHTEYIKDWHEHSYLITMYEEPDYDLVIWDDDTSLVDRDE